MVLRRGKGKPKARTWVLVVIAGVGLGVGCYYLSQQQLSGESTMELAREITLGSEMSLLTSAVWIAENKGYFQEEGLDVTIQEFASGRTALDTMLNEGGLDIVTAAQTPVMFNSFDRSDYAIIAAMVHSDNDVKILAHRETGIENPLDLRGKKVGLTKGSTGQFFIGLYLADNGLKLSEIEIIDLEASDLPQALADGHVDAISVWEPHILNARKLLGEAAVLLPSKGIYREDFYFVASGEFIGSNPRELRAFLRAIARAEDFIQHNEDSSLRIVSERLGLDQELMSLVWGAYSFELLLDQIMLLTLEDEARWAIREGLTTANEVPNFLDFIHIDGLVDVRPEAVTIIR